MPNVKVFDKGGKAAGDLKLDDTVFSIKETKSRVVEGETVELQRNLLANLHQTVLAEQANKRQGTHLVKTRGEVRGGGRKPWKQKKLGRARQGSIRAPHWPGGGVAFGPVLRDHDHKTNRKARRLAARTALTHKIADGVVVAIDSMAFERFKTKDALALLQAHGGNGPRTLVLLAEYNAFAVKSFANLPHVVLRTAPDISARDIVVARKIIADKAALQRLEEVWSK